MDSPAPTLWICGASGSGKSTIGELLSQQVDCVCYEGDAFLLHLDPFGGLVSKKPSPEEKLQLGQGVREELREVCRKGLQNYRPLITGQGRGEFSLFRDMYRELCRDIREKQRERGQTRPWVVTQAVYTK